MRDRFDGRQTGERLDTMVFLSLLFFMNIYDDSILSEERMPSDAWPEIRSDIIEAFRGSLSCSAYSRQIGFCRLDNLQVPEEQSARLSDGCRGQPVSFISRHLEVESRMLYAEEVEQLLGG